MSLQTCERCKQEAECRFYGHPSNVDHDRAQNGEWLCLVCVPLRAAELDEAITAMQKFLASPEPRRRP